MFGRTVEATSPYTMLHNAMFRYINGISDTAVTDFVQATGRTATAPLYSDPAQYALTAFEVTQVLATDWKDWNPDSFFPAHWEFLQAFVSRWRTLGGTFIDLAAWIVAAMSSSSAAGPMAARIGMEERDLKF